MVVREEGESGRVLGSNLQPPALRVGAVSYLNTKPLIHQFHDWAGEAELILDYPSRLADRLAGGDLDVALIPSIECLQNARYAIVSDACIACRGPVLSVKLLSRVAMDRIRTLALDEGSRTSVVLVQILLRRRFGLIPELRPLPLDGSFRDTAADAVLLIGDRAIHAPRGLFPLEWDLGAEWCRDMGVPFVFAIWAAREGIGTVRMASALCRMRDAGLTHLEEIATAAAPGVGLDVATCLAYLRDNLHFILGPSEHEGLQLFRQHASELGLLQRVPGSDNFQVTVT
ncbi:MAG: menaquinone biosynthetic enzyme MqnA/MqnD family protein [Pirellulaceae bacterium]